MIGRFSLLSVMMPLLVGVDHTYDPDRPLIIRECDRCGIGLAGIDAEAGITRCRECQASSQTGTTDPIDLVCRTCHAQPGEKCDRRNMGGRWAYHRARVDVAGRVS
jgi:hypothetical protein